MMCAAKLLGFRVERIVFAVPRHYLEIDGGKTCLSFVPASPCTSLCSTYRSRHTCTHMSSRFYVMVWWRQEGVWFAMMMKGRRGAMTVRIAGSVPPQPENGQQRTTRQSERGAAFTAFVVEKKSKVRVPRPPWARRSSKKEQHQGFPRGPPP